MNSSARSLQRILQEWFGKRSSAVSIFSFSPHNSLLRVHLNIVCGSTSMEEDIFSNSEKGRLVSGLDVKGYQKCEH